MGLDVCVHQNGKLKKIVRLMEPNPQTHTNLTINLPALRTVRVWAVSLARASMSAALEKRINADRLHWFELKYCFL